MQTVQRVYLYVMSWAALVALSSGITRLAGLLLAFALGLPLAREPIAFWAGVVMVAFPLFVGHAVWLERHVRRESRETQARLYHVYAYATAAIGMYYLFRATLRGLSLAFERWLGIGEPVAAVWWANWLTQNAHLLWAVIVLWYSRRLIALSPEETPTTARWPRLFVFLIGEVGLILGTVGGIYILSLLLLWFLPPLPPSEWQIGVWWREGSAPRLAWMITGWAFWTWAWRQLEFWHEHPLHARAWTRQAFYFVNVGLGLSLVLLALGYLVRQGMLGLLGEPLGPRYRWWPSLAAAGVALGVGSVIWWVHRWRVQQEWGDLRGQWFHVAVGRGYTYVVCAVALGVTWWGAMTALRVLTTLLLPGEGLGGNWWRQHLATGTAMFLVAAPVWLWHWRQIQHVATRPDRIGQQERASWMRRVYLYGVGLVAGLVMLVYSGRIVYALWLWALGVSTPIFWTTATNAIGPGVLSVLVWVYHLYTIQQDNRRSEAELSLPDREALLAEREALLRRLAEIEAQLKEWSEENAPMSFPSNGQK